MAETRRVILFPPVPTPLPKFVFTKLNMIVHLVSAFRRLEADSEYNSRVHVMLEEMRTTIDQIEGYLNERREN